MGSIHCKNLVDHGADVVCVKNKTDHPSLRNASIDELPSLLKEGFSSVVIASPDTLLVEHTKLVVDAGFTNILLEKPGAVSSSELTLLQRYAVAKGASVKMDYQRGMDDKIHEMLSTVSARVSEGYSLDYVSIFSCDARQPPQDSPQALNQGCHDYALLLNVLESAGDLNPVSLGTEGINW